jgi:hypothetical protein
MSTYHLIFCIPSTLFILSLQVNFWNDVSYSYAYYIPNPSRPAINACSLEPYFLRAAKGDSPLYVIFFVFLLILACHIQECSLSIVYAENLH